MIARALGSVYTVPVGMGGILAFDWFYLPPTHALEIPDAGNLVQVLVVLGLAVLLGELGDRNARRAEAAEHARGLVADEQAALRRVATLVATGATPDRLFTGVAHEVGMLFRVHGVRIARYDGDELVHVAEWISPGRQTPDAVRPRSTRAGERLGGGAQDRTRCAHRRLPSASRTGRRTPKASPSARWWVRRSSWKTVRGA